MGMTRERPALRTCSMRYFTVSEANALLPALERVLGNIRRLMQEVSATTERLQILDVIWGSRLLMEGNPDKAEALELRAHVTQLMGDIGAVVEDELNARGVRFPQGGLEHGLIDFPTTWEGRVVYLCWRQGEPEIEAWHEVDGGFAGRQPLSAEQIRGMGSAESGASW